MIKFSETFAGKTFGCSYWYLALKQVQFWQTTASSDLSRFEGFSRRLLSFDFFKTSNFYVCHHFYLCVQYELLLGNYCNSFVSLLKVEVFIDCKKYLAEWNLVIYLQIHTHYSLAALVSI